MSYLKRYASIGLLLLLLSFISCTDLTESPTSEVTTENYNPAQDDIVSLIAPVYTPLRTVLGFQTWLSAQSLSSDELVIPIRPNGWREGGRNWRLHRHTWNPTDAIPNSIYEMSFDGINAANRVLLQIENGEIPLEQGREKLIAELMVARAFYYSILLNNQGNVPIVTDFSSEELPQQSNRQQVYDFIVQELTANIPKLSEVADQTTYGRFNKWTGKMILAEIYLNAKIYTGTPQWEKVINVTQEIIDSGKYELENNYESNFSRNNHTSSEIIFAVPYDEVDAPGNVNHMLSLIPEQQSQYNMKAQPWGGTSSQPQFINSYKENDQRLEDTWIGGPQYNQQGEEIVNFEKNVPSLEERTEWKNGYRVGKYDIYDGINRNSDVDFPFYRYAETLLMKAEALLRSGNSSEAAVLVTQVRMRAFDDPANAQVTGAELENGSSYIFGHWEADGTIYNPDRGDDIKYGRMMDELGWEFGMEGHRRTDLIRFGVFTTKRWFKHEPQGDYTRLFPIPETVLNTNTNIEQNPGY